MSARAHAYTGAVPAGPACWIGHCKCGYETSPRARKIDAQLDLTAHIHADDELEPAGPSESAPHAGERRPSSPAARAEAAVA